MNTIICFQFSRNDDDGNEERGEGKTTKRRKQKPCLKNHVNENIFILFMLEYQIKFSAFEFFPASFFASFCRFER
jgi:hypothetical protein